MVSVPCGYIRTDGQRDVACVLYVCYVLCSVCGQFQIRSDQGFNDGYLEEVVISDDTLGKDLRSSCAASQSRGGRCVA